MHEKTLFFAILLFETNLAAKLKMYKLYFHTFYYPLSLLKYKYNNKILQVQFYLTFSLDNNILSSVIKLELFVFLEG